MLYFAETTAEEEKLNDLKPVPTHTNEKLPLFKFISEYIRFSSTLSSLVFRVRYLKRERLRSLSCLSEPKNVELI